MSFFKVRNIFFNYILALILSLILLKNINNQFVVLCFVICSSITYIGFYLPTAVMDFRESLDISNWEISKESMLHFIKQNHLLMFFKMSFSIISLFTVIVSLFSITNEFKFFSYILNFFMWNTMIFGYFMIIFFRKHIFYSECIMESILKDDEKVVVSD